MSFKKILSDADIKAERLTKTTDSNGLVSYTFPSAFGTGVTAVVVSMESADGSYVKLNAAPTKTGFTIRALKGQHTHTPTTTAVYSGGGIASQTAFTTTNCVTTYASPTSAAGYSGGGIASQTAFTTTAVYSGGGTVTSPSGTNSTLTRGSSGTYYVVAAQLMSSSSGGTPNQFGGAGSAGTSSGSYYPYTHTHTITQAGFTTTNAHTGGGVVSQTSFTTTTFLTGLGSATTAAAHTGGGIVSQTSFTTTSAITAIGAGNEDVLANTQIQFHYIAIGT